PTFVFYITFVMILTFLAAIAYLIRRERTSRIDTENLLHELEASHRQLQDYADKVADLATTEERNRLAREIHDSLGHYMTVINVQLEKAIAFRQRDAEAADQSVKDAKRLAAEALRDVRRSVGALRSTETFIFNEALEELADHMSNETVDVALSIEGNDQGFSKQSLKTLYRVAQEGLTNIQKHANATQATIQVEMLDHQAKLTVDDDGQGFDSTDLAHLKNGDHFGLQGIRERVELINGSFEVNSQPNQGTRLSITVPKNPLMVNSIKG
ncbi:MAG: sensor histidine kinase, partial [Chloroflexota bacterium]